MYNVQNQNRHKKEEVNATSSFDNIDDDYWDEEDYYGDDDQIDADTDDYGVGNEENLPVFSGRTKKKMMTTIPMINSTFEILYISLVWKNHVWLIFSDPIEIK